MLFQQTLWPGIVDGSVTLTFRRWRSPRAVAGRRHRVAGGMIEITEVREADPGRIAESDAARAGYPTLSALLTDLRARQADGLGQGESSRQTDGLRQDESSRQADGLRQDESSRQADGLRQDESSPQADNSRRDDSCQGDDSRRGEARWRWYRVEFRYLGADPRDALAGDDALTAAQRAELDRRLARLDAASSHGPWTAATLDVIAAHPGTRAGDLAALLGRGRDPFKIDVRKLKNLGLTLSLDVGYRLSPRGEAYRRSGEVPGSGKARRSQGAPGSVEARRSQGAPGSGGSRFGDVPGAAEDPGSGEARGNGEAR